MKKLLTYATLCLLFISCAKSDEDVFLDNKSVQQNDLKQQIISILGYAEEDNSLARAIIGSKKKFQANIR